MREARKSYCQNNSGPSRQDKPGVNTVQPRRLPDRRAGLRRQHRRSSHPRRPSARPARAFRPAPHRLGRGPWHDRPDAHRRRPQADRLGLDLCPAQRHHPAAGGRSCHPARPVRQLGAGQRNGRRFSRRAPAGVLQPADGGRAAAQARGAAAGDRAGGGSAGGALHGWQVPPGRVQPAPGRAAAAQDGQAPRVGV